MDFKFSKDSGESQPKDIPGEKKKQSPLLVLLLILVGCFAYLYFFTDLIKPQEPQKTAEVAAPAPKVAKIPLPPRKREPTAMEGKAPEKIEAPKAVASVPAAVTAPAATPAGAAAKPAPVPAPKPLQALTPAKPKEEPKKAESAIPVGKKPLPATIANKKNDSAPAGRTEEKKPAVADKMRGPSKNGKRALIVDGSAKSTTVIKAKRVSVASWSLVIGNYVLEEALSTDIGRVRKAGFEPVIKPSIRKKTAMNRLFISEFTDRASAHATLEKLKHYTSDAFILEHGGRYSVYAGSYAQNESANTEKERLKASGFPVAVKRTDIAIPSQSLSVGPFNSKKAADAALAKLQGAGVKPVISQK